MANNVVAVGFRPLLREIVRIKSFCSGLTIDEGLCLFVKGRGGELKCYRHTDRHTDIQTDPPTKGVLEEHSLLKNSTFSGHVRYQGGGRKPSR